MVCGNGREKQERCCVMVCNAVTSITAMSVCVYLCHVVIYSSLLSHLLSCIHITHLFALGVYT